MRVALVLPEGACRLFTHQARAIRISLVESFGSWATPVPLGGRAFEIKEIYVRSAGELVTKNECIDAKSDYQRQHTSALRKALGPYRAMSKTKSG